MRNVADVPQRNETTKNEILATKRNAWRAKRTHGKRNVLLPRVETIGVRTETIRVQNETEPI